MLGFEDRPWAEHRVGIVVRGSIAKFDAHDELRSYLIVPGPWTNSWRGRVSMTGIHCVHAAIQMALTSTSLADLLRRCVNLTGDVDTVAAIAFAGAANSSAIEHDLPPTRIDGLERGPYGIDYLRTLDDALVSYTSRG